MKPTWVSGYKSEIEPGKRTIFQYHRFGYNVYNWQTETRYF